MDVPPIPELIQNTDIGGAAGAAGEIAEGFAAETALKPIIPATTLGQEEAALDEEILTGKEDGPARYLRGRESLSQILYVYASAILILITALFWNSIVFDLTKNRIDGNLLLSAVFFTAFSIFILYMARPAGRALR